MFSKSKKLKEKEKEKEKNKKNKGESQEHLLMVEWESLPRNQMDQGLHDFYLNLYQDESKRPYWDAIYQLVKKDHAEECLDFLIDYHHFLSVPMFDSWNILYNQYVDQINITGPMTKAFKKMNEQILNLHQDQKGPIDLTKIKLELNFENILNVENGEQLLKNIAIYLLNMVDSDKRMAIEEVFEKPIHDEKDGAEKKEKSSYKLLKK